MVKKYDKFLIEFANYISISFIPKSVADLENSYRYGRQLQHDLLYMCFTSEQVSILFLIKLFV